MELKNRENEEITSSWGKSRRSFLKKTSLAAIAVAGADLFVLSANYPTNKNIQGEEVPWFRRITRWGQTNITEKDPANYDISWWRNYWKSTQTQGVIINAGGIVAYYPSKVPLHQQAQYNEGRDLFGDICRAAHEDGLAVFARMDSNRAHEEFYKAHPDWFAIDASGNPYKAGDLYITCVNSPYYNEHIPSILREIIELYHPEGFTDNSWSGLGRDSICYCENCKKSFYKRTGKDIPIQANWSDQVYREWIRWNYDRRLEIWDLFNHTTRTAGGPNCIWAGMNSGSISGQSKSFRDYKEICKRADIIMLDSQARSDADGFQQNGTSGKLIHGLLGWDKLIPESMAMYQMGRPTFRLSSKPLPEAQMWMIDGMAGGIQPWWHHVGAYHEDRRMYHTAAPIFNWHKRNEQYLINRLPVASVGVVWSQQNMDFYGHDATEQLVELPWRGMTQALMRARIPYLPVHADHIDRDAHQFSVLILPNVGVMTDDQVASIKRFVKNGGSLIATGESSLFNEWGDQRSDYALGDLFGAHVMDSNKNLTEEARLKRAGDTLHTYLRLSPELRAQVDGPKNGTEPPVTGKRHPILQGFEETDILPFGGMLDALRLDAGTEVIMTFIPSFPIYPPETSWMRTPKTDIHGIILNTNPSGSRIVFIPADFDRQFGRYNLPDHGNLLANAIRWASKGEIPLTVEGKGLLDCHLYKQHGRLVLHIVNLTSAGTWRQPIDEYIPVGPIKVSVQLPEDVRGRGVQLLVSDQKASCKVEKGWVEFTVNSILDHEVVVVS
ncbi:MAG TPA: Tat pathway signal protein [Prolixibacteraceae bacterium]|nr:Tat pathway signal protein [Prolixibacteraceae bacterium]